jgi:ABC-type multidrug transport system permease subunit
VKRIKKYIPMIILLDTIILVLIYIAFCIVLNMFNLVFRKWVLILFLLMLATGFIAGVIQLLLKIRKSVLKNVLICIFMILVSVTGSVIIPITIFAFANEEHIVERDNVKYVAHVDGWLKTYVHYYEYKGPFLEGKMERIEEYYGKGGFDPIGSEDKYTVIRTTYYDEHGNLISVIEGN